MDGDSISEGIICENALPVYVDLWKETPSTSAEGESGFTFKASRGWFWKFRHQCFIYCVVRHGEATSSNNEATKNYFDEFCDFVDAGDYVPQQVFGCDETGIFRKKYA